jgi:hypothetical protein
LPRYHRWKVNIVVRRDVADGFNSICEAIIDLSDYLGLSKRTFAFAGVAFDLEPKLPPPTIGS